MQQNIPNCGKVIPNITDIPEGIKITCPISDPNKECIDNDIVHDEEHCQH